MEYTIIFILLSISTSFYFLITRSGRRKSGVTTRLPPGPYPFPIIGNIFKLGNKPHHSLAALSKTYKPLMSLKLGTTTTIVVSSREIVKGFFLKHDVSFSGRWVLCVANAHYHYKYATGWMQVGDQWRTLRKIYKEHLFAMRQLDSSQLLRKKKVQQLLDYVNNYSDSGKPVDIGQIASITTLNVLSNFVFSIDLAQFDSQSSQDFTDLVWLLFQNAGRPNLADFFPVLRPLDPQGMLIKAKLYTGKLLAIVEEYINKRLQKRATSSSDASSSKDLMDLLLDMSQNEKPPITLVGIRYLVFDLFIAGTDTTASSLEWAMAELIKNPEKMSKARSELEEVIGKEDRTLQESDIPRLPYLQAVVKETLRLHPPVTFLLPHKATTMSRSKATLSQKMHKSSVTCGPWVKTRTYGRMHNGSSQSGFSMLESTIKVMISN